MIRRLALDEAGLATAPSSAVPPVARRRRAEDAKIRAAGLMIVAPDDLALFLKRSDKGDHAGEWCFPGGKIEDDEEPLDAAIRETHEETGWTPTTRAEEIDDRLTDEDVNFTTFRVDVEKPLVPDIDDEHSGWAWAPLDDPPQPLHPGVAATLDRLISEGAEDAAESGGSRALLRSTIKYPPEKGPGDERAIDLSMERGGVGKTLKEAPQARRFGLGSHDEAEDLGVGRLSSSELSRFRALPPRQQSEVVRLLEQIRRYREKDPERAAQLQKQLDRIAGDAEFDETKHPRGEGGKFGKGGGEGKKTEKKSEVASREKQQEALNGIADYLGLVAKHAPLSKEKFVLENGRPYFVSERTFAGKRSPMKQCFKNATQDALATGRTYVEGFITVHGVPIEHAWTVDEKGDVHDSTIRPTDAVAGYYGVAFSRDYLMRAMAENRVYGILGAQSMTGRQLVSGEVKDFRDPEKSGQDEFREQDHPRGQPGNAGQFGSGGGGGKTEAKPEKSSIGAPGVAARGLDEADAVKKQWAKESPIRTIDDLFAHASENQAGLAMVSEKIASEVDEGTKFKNPGVKGRLRVEEKIVGQGKTPGRINDVVRGGFVARDPRQADKIVERLAEKFEIADEGWFRTPLGYLDRKVIVRFPNGQCGEVQLWHPELLKVKSEKGHKLYEEERALPIGHPRRAELAAEMQRLYGSVKTGPEWCPPVCADEKIASDAERVLTYGSVDGDPFVWTPGEAWVFSEKGEWTRADDAEIGMSGRVLSKTDFDKKFEKLPPLPRGALGRGAEDEKSSKADAEYVDGPVKTEPCEKCFMFREPSGCSAVRGAISPTGHCWLWRARGAEDAEFAEQKHPRDESGRFGSGGGAKKQDLSGQQKEDVQRFIGDSSENSAAINRALRGDGELTAAQRRVVKSVDDAIASAPPLEKETVTYRGLDEDRTGSTDPAFTSLSANRETAEEFGTLGRPEKGVIYRVTLPAGTRALSTRKLQDPSMAEQDEYILPRGAKFEKIEKKKSLFGKRSKIPEIEVRYVPPVSRVGGDEALALDRASVRELNQDGHLGVEVTNISKANVCPYLGSEIPGAEELGLTPDQIYQLLRDPEELARAADSFNNLPLLDEHVPVFAADYREQAQKHVVGATGSEAVFQAPYLKNSLKIWDEKAIAAIRSGEQKELSAGYHYRPDMTAGVHEGVKYDGVMRDIVGNHVALVREGRAGADVVVGDSKERLSEMAKKSYMTRQAAIAIGVLAPYVRSKLAADKRIDLRPVLCRLTVDDVRDNKSAIEKAIARAARGKLARDAKIGEVAELLDMIASHGEDGDEVVEPEVQEAMEKTAGPEPAPMKKEPPPVEEDDDPHSELKGFLKDKLSDSDHAHACQMIDGKGASDAEGGEEKLKELGAKDDQNDTDAPGGESEQEHRDNEREWRRQEGATDDDLEKYEGEEEARVKKDGTSAKDQPPHFKGSPKTGGKMSGDRAVVTKDDMDTAMKAAVAAVRKTERGIREAERAVQPWVGQLNMSFDSDEEVYRKALKMMGVPGVDKVHASALPTILEMQPKPGARRAAARVASDAAAAGSSDGVRSFADFYPDAARIRLT